MAATSDGGVVSAFHTSEGHNCAVKINADGTYPWGEQGIILFEVTDIEETSNSKIVNLLNVYNLKGQRIKVNDLSELKTGIYISQGWAQDGRLVTKKTTVI